MRKILPLDEAESERRMRSLAKKKGVDFDLLLLLAAKRFKEESVRSELTEAEIDALIADDEASGVNP